MDSAFWAMMGTIGFWFIVGIGSLYLLCELYDFIRRYRRGL